MQLKAKLKLNLKSIQKLTESEFWFASHFKKFFKSENVYQSVWFLHVKVEKHSCLSFIITKMYYFNSIFRCQ